MRNAECIRIAIGRLSTCW